MAKIDEPWNAEAEKPLAIAIASPHGNRSAQIVMTTTLGRVLVKADSTDGLWHDITPKTVRTEYVKKPQTDYKRDIEK
jgi:hypothetical protein